MAARGRDSLRHAGTRTEYMDANKCVEELLQHLDEERRNVRRSEGLRVALAKDIGSRLQSIPREKLAAARLQGEVARSKSEGTMREKLIHELEEERRLRLESEKRLREVTEESELGRAQMVSLQQQFSRMEETLRSLLQNPAVVEQAAVDTADIMKAYRDKLSEEVRKQYDGPGQKGSPRTEPDPPNAGQSGEGKGEGGALLDRLKALEEKNSALSVENESQREQYERCLDEVANQVVQALLTQKDLREECLKLRTRVFDLEQQNRALGVLFQQRIKPASDLLLQKLHSRIMDLSAADLLLEPERSKAFLLSRNTDSTSSDVHLNGRAGLPVAKCLSQLSLTAPVYPRSSRSSSELSLSSACSEFSSGSYTWNDGRSCGKMATLTWEKRLSLGSSAPSNICAPPEEQLPTRRKESNILEGLRKLQRRKHRSSSASSKVSKSADKDCMNSNEGIYSLGIKSGSKGVSKPTHVVRALAMGGKKFSYDSDDADDELAHCSRADDIPTKDGWFHCKRLSRSISDSLCSWEGMQDSGGDCSSVPGAFKHPPGCDSKERPEKLLSFINSFLPEGERKSAFSKPSLRHFNPPDPAAPNPPSDVDDSEELNSESGDIRASFSQAAERAERESKRLSRDAAKLLAQQWLGKEQGRTRSADGRPRPFSLIKDPDGETFAQSEESVLAIFDAQGEPIELCARKLTAGAGARSDPQSGKVMADYAELLPRERPTRQKSASARNYTVLESPEKPSEYLINREGGAERLPMQLTPQRKLIKPPSNRLNKGHSIPPETAVASKIPGRNKPVGSPARMSKGYPTEPSNNGNSGASGQEKPSSSYAVKMPRFMKTPGICSQSPKAVGSKLPGRAERRKGSSSSSPRLSRHHLEYEDRGEQPTRDKHCETSKNQLRSPSPPPPPGRSTSLLVRPNYEGSPQAHKSWVAQTSTPTTVRGPPPSYHTSLVPNMQSTLPIKDKDCLDLDAGYGTALAPQKLVEKSIQHLQKLPATTQTTNKGTSKRVTAKDYLPSANSGRAPETDNAPKSSKNVPPPYGALRGSSLQNSFASKRGSTHDNVYEAVQKTSISLPSSLQDTAQGRAEDPQRGKAVVSSPGSVASSPNGAEKASKTRIPMGFKAFLKSPPSHANNPSVAGKQEKDHINSVSKETVTSNASTQYDSVQSVYIIDSSSKTSVSEVKADVQCRLADDKGHASALPEEENCGKRSSRLFSRSISVTTKPHLKPALGMNGAKARSQSFSTNYIEKPNINALDGPGKIRTQIITNTGERGNSLSRQTSLEVPSVGESPVHSPRTRLSHYGGMTGSNSQSVLPERTSKGTAKGETVTSPSQKATRGLPVSDRIGLSNVRKTANVASHPQCHAPSSGVNPAREAECSQTTTSNEPDFSREVQSRADSVDTEETKVSPSVCTIEEKVMMGIEENLQKCQEQEKVAASETKQKTGPSLANWFGLRKSKLPALSGKKVDPPKGKEEKKESKIGSVLAGKQMKSDKRKEKKKNDNQQRDSLEGQSLSEMNNKLSTIMDHCNNQMGQIASQIQCTTAFIGKEQFVKELLGRTAVKGGCVSASPPGFSTPGERGEGKGDMEICADAAVSEPTQANSRRFSHLYLFTNTSAAAPPLHHLIPRSLAIDSHRAWTATHCQPFSESNQTNAAAVVAAAAAAAAAVVVVVVFFRSGSQHRTQRRLRHLSATVFFESHTLLMTQKITLRAENEERRIPDHVIGSGCQTRTLDSGIGTFPLPDSVTRAGGRHLPKSESSPDVVAVGSCDPDRGASSSPLKVPSRPKTHPHAPTSMAHSLSDPSVTRNGNARDAHSRLPALASPDSIQTKRSSLCSPRGNTSSEDKETDAEGKMEAQDHAMPRERDLQVVTYSGSSSDTETGPEGPGRSPPRKRDSAQQNEETLTRSGEEKTPSIMDYYQREMYAPVEKASRRVSQYDALHKDRSLDARAADRLSKEVAVENAPVSGQASSLHFSLESLNERNHGGGGGLYPDSGPGRADGPSASSSSSFSGRPATDPKGSLSDSLYDSFSSCTSQGSNEA
ncbi:nck-associated protein 5-like isoform 3-T3 [Spinachia spinachia]